MNLHKICTCILFALFTISTSFSQIVSEIIPTLEIDTLLNNGSKDNRINIAFSNILDASSSDILYNSQEELNSSIYEILTYFDYNHEHAKSGYSQYRNFFNVQSIWFPEPLKFEQKPEFYEISQGVRDALFLPWADESHGFATMVFSGSIGQGAGVVREKRVGDVYLFEMVWDVVSHEICHTFPTLYDEYTGSGAWSNFKGLEGPNVTSQNDLEEVPWRKWIDQTTPIPTPYENTYFNSVGLFEGNISGYFDSYRPTARSCYMGAGGFGEGFGQDMCPVCLQRFITMLYKYVNVIENPQPVSPQVEINGNSTITFSAEIIKPEPNTQKYEWFVNGQLFATGQESVDINFNACDQYIVDLVVTDTTDAVRFDEKFKDLYPEPKQKRTWYVDQSEVSSYNLSTETTIKFADCSGIENGEIVITAQGGLAPYTYILDGVGSDRSTISDLSAGSYSLVVNDANGCSVYEEIEILQDQLLDFEVCSTYYGGSWELSASLFQNDNGELTYLWSTGETNSEIVVTENGNYTLLITNSDGCTVQREISLSSVSNGIELSSHISHATNNNDNGAIYLELSGGLAPYDVSWNKDEVLDLTNPISSQVIASDIDPWTPKEYAFDNSFEYNENFWAERFTQNNFIGFDFEIETEIEVYSIISNVDTKERDAKSWVLQGSNNGETWIDIDKVENFEFINRLQQFDFILEEPVTYRFYRLSISENWGSDRIVIQEVQLGIINQKEINQNKNKRDIQGLVPGNYSFKVNDLNNSCIEGQIEIINVDVPIVDPISIAQDGTYKVKVENPNPDISYYWLDGSDGSNLIHIGASFQPPNSGNYYVRPYNSALSVFGEQIKGFSVTMTTAPQIEITTDALKVVNPNESYDYFWYNQIEGGEPIHIGIEFIPDTEGKYYVSALEKRTPVIPIDPDEIEGVKLWMDATDLDGDGITDEALESSSAYSWKFRAGGQWEENSFFPYRSNYQNGNGIVDFATIWYQYLTTDIEQMRTVILVYQESTFSYDKTALLYGLNENIPRHSDATQLFSNDAPATTLNGKTFLNGERVDPLIQENPMDFIILSVVFSDLINVNFEASVENWEGKLGELIIWDVALSDVQIKGVNEFLRKKWLSTADLESTRVNVIWGDDTDGDDVLDTFDNCLETPAGEIVDTNGCSESQKDDDSDTVMNDVDTCANTPIGETADTNGCSESQKDDDNDGVMNNEDLCPDTTLGSNINASGCFSLSENNFNIETISETCPDKNNGQLIIDAVETHNYIARYNETDYNFTTRLVLDNLLPGSNDLCITVEGETYQQCFTITIDEGTSISGKSSATKSKTTVDILEGTAPYEVYVNGTSILRTMSSTFDVDTKHGDLIEVKTDVACQGVYSETVQLFDIMAVYPNPTQGLFELAIPLDLKDIGIEIYNNNFQRIVTKIHPVTYNKVQLDLTNKAAGMYYVKVLSDTPVMLKIIKK